MATQRQEKKAATREKVLGAAKTLFEAGGYEAATIRTIAAVAGVSTGAVFSNFPDKASIYRTLYGHAPLSAEVGRELLAGLRFAASVIKSGEPWSQHCDEAIAGPLAKASA